VPACGCFVRVTSPSPNPSVAQLREASAALVSTWTGGNAKTVRKAPKAMQAPITRGLQQALELALKATSGTGPATSPCYALWTAWLRLLPDTASPFIAATCDKFARKFPGATEAEVGGVRIFPSPPPPPTRASYASLCCAQVAKLLAAAARWWLRVSKAGADVRRALAAGSEGDVDATLASVQAAVVDGYPWSTLRSWCPLVSFRVAVKHIAHNEVRRSTPGHGPVAAIVVAPTRTPMRSPASPASQRIHWWPCKWRWHCRRRASAQVAESARQVQAAPLVPAMRSLRTPTAAA